MLVKMPTELFSDAALAIFNSTDPTKKVMFDVSGITAGQTRVITIPDSNGTIVFVGSASHDGFSDTLADEHVAHSSVSINAGTALTGGGDITTSRTLNVDETAINHDNTINGGGNQHIDWTNAAQNFKTSGNVESSGNINFTDGKLTVQGADAPIFTGKAPDFIDLTGGLGDLTGGAGADGKIVGGKGNTFGYSGGDLYFTGGQGGEGISDEKSGWGGDVEVRGGDPGVDNGGGVGAYGNVILCKNGGFVYLDQDSSSTGGRFYFGEGQDAYIGYNGTDLEIKTNAVGSGGVKILSDTFFSGSGSGLPYGEISVQENATETTISAQGTFYQITIFDTNGDFNLTTPDHTNDHITITKTGEYLIEASVCLDGVGGGSASYTIVAFKNNGATELTNVHCSTRLAGTSGEEAAMTPVGLVNLTANDTIELWIKNTTGTQNVIVEDCTLSLIQVGG